MNALSPLAARSLPATNTVPPRLSPDLGYAVRRLVEDPAQPPMPIPPGLRNEALSAMDRFGNLLGQVEPDTVRRWLFPLNAAVRNPLSADDFNTRAAAIAVAVSDLPSCVFTAPSQREALATFQFFPSAADVRALLEPLANELRRPFYALRRIAMQGDDAPGNRATAEQAREGFARVQAALAEGCAHLVEPEPRATPKAVTLSRETLNALYARQGLTGPSRAGTAQPYRIEVQG